MSKQHDDNDVGDIFSTVVYGASLKVIFVIAAALRYNVHLIDVVTAFLNSLLIGPPVYISVPFAKNAERTLYELHLVMSPELFKDG